MKPVVIRSFEISLRLQLVALILELSRKIRSADSEDAHSLPLLDDFLALVEEQFSRHHSVEHYARRLGLTPKALTMRVSRALGKSAREIIQERCLLEAKRLLAYSELSIAEVGYEIGFEDPNYFSRFFRSAEKTSPGVFRTKTRSGT